MKYYDVQDIGVEGKGWENTKHVYDRLPAHAEGVVTEAVWNLSRRSAGMAVRFRTDATAIHTRTILRYPGDPSLHYRKYLDLYARDDSGTWQWAGVSRFGFVPSGETALVEGIPAKMREYMLYLPGFFSIERLEIGVPEDAAFEGLPPRTDKTIAIYGTSIVHGSSASRPGMIFSSILGRRLDVPVINLGFSGSARMEPELGAIIAELDPAAFVIDPLANMSKQLIETNAEAFMQHLLTAQPQTPMLMVEDRVHAHAWLHNDMPRREGKWAAFHAVFRKLQEQGTKNLLYQTGRELFGDDTELTVDGSHPSDLGYRRMADVCEPYWRHLLGTGG